MEKPLQEWVLMNIKKREQWFVELCRDLVRIPSPNPPGDTRRIAEFIQKMLEARHIPYTVYAPNEECPNIVATIGSGEKPKLVLNGHLDAYAVEKPETWSVDPYGGLIRDGRMYGRGSCDMKAGVAAALGNFLMFHEEGAQLDGTVVLALVSDEESGSKWGAWWLVDNVPDILGDAVLVGEPSGVRTPLIGQKAPLWLRLTTHSQPQHGSYSNGKDAVWQMAKAILAAQTLNELKYEPPEKIRWLVERLKQKEAQAGMGREWWLDQPSVNFGVIQGGLKINVVPSSCTLELDTRVPFGATRQDILAALEQKFTEESLNVDLEIITGERDNPNYTPWEDVFVQVVAEAVQIATDQLAEPLLMPYLTDERVWRHKGIPAVSCGPKDYNMAAADEYIIVGEYLQAVQVFGLTMANFCGLRLA